MTPNPVTSPRITCCTRHSGPCGIWSWPPARRHHPVLRHATPVPRLGALVMLPPHTHTPSHPQSSAPPPSWIVSLTVSPQHRHRLVPQWHGWAAGDTAVSNQTKPSSSQRQTITSLSRFCSTSVVSTTEKIIPQGGGRGHGCDFKLGLAEQASLVKKWNLSETQGIRQGAMWLSGERSF